MISEIIHTSIKTATIKRYSQSHISRQETVLEHTGFVTLFCYLVGIQHKEVNIGSVLSKAVVHDIEESIVGDIASPTKYSSKEMREIIGKFEVAAVTRIMDYVFGGYNEQMDYDWSQSKDESIEGLLVRLADIIAVLYKIYEETVIYNNRSIASHIAAVERNLHNFSKEIDWINELVDEALEVCLEVKKHGN